MSFFPSGYRKVYKNGESLLRAVVKNGFVRNGQSLFPTVMILAVTYRCNSKCTMCNIWKKKCLNELTLEEMERVFSGGFFRNIEHVNLTGGEPMLRKDLPQIISLLIQHMPRLRKITIPSNGLVGSCGEALREIVTFCNEKAIVLTVRVSLDGIGSVHDRIRNIPGAYEKAIYFVGVLEGLRKEFDFGMGINTVVCHENIRDLENIRNFALTKDLDATFIFPCFTETFFENSSLEEQIGPKDFDKEIFTDFLKEEMERSSVMNSNRLYYDQIIRHMKSGEKRFMPCPFVNQGVMLDPEGDVYYCQNSTSIGNIRHNTIEHIYFGKENQAYRNTLIEKVCPRCMNGCMMGAGLRTDIFGYFRYLIKNRGTYSIKKGQL